MMIADALVGVAVEALLAEVLDGLRHLRKRSAYLLQLQNLLERIQPSVKELSTVVQNGEHPARLWLAELHKQLEAARDLANGSSNIKYNVIRLVGTSKEYLAVNENIRTLLQEASTLHWASGLSIQRVLTENDAMVLEMLRAAQEREEQILQRIADLTSKVDILSAMSNLEQVSSSEVLDASSPTEAPIDRRLGASTYNIEKPEVAFGGEAVAEDLINHLLSEDYRKWIGLWGMGGIGKTFTARKVYHDSRIRQHFSGGVIWFTVSKDQEGAKDLVKQLLGEIDNPTSVSQLPQNLEAMKSHLKSRLDRDRVLLVLDDVWEKDVLEHLDVVSENKKGVILVTTRDQGIMRKVIHLGRIFEIPKLSEEHSWQFFCYHAFHDSGGLVPLELDNVIANDVAKECGGLPLALEVIGSTMAGKTLLPADEALGESLSSIWETALRQLRSAKCGKTEYEALYSKLQLSVDSLSKEDACLPDCFFYFAAFPEDREVNVDVLLRMWSAEGLVQDDPNDSHTSEQRGKLLLACLVARSMIEVRTDYNGDRCCKVHDLMRELARRNLQWNSATGQDIQVSDRECLYAAGLLSDKLPTEWTTSATISSAKRLSMISNTLQKFPEPEHFNAPHLRVLILSENWLLEHLSPRFFQNLSQLRVLDLSKTGIRRIPGKLLQKLTSLVLLNLNDCRELEMVSNKVNSLRSLKFLLLDGCLNLQKLPQVNLTNLEEYRALVNISKAEGDSRSRRNCGPWRTRREWRSIPYVLPSSLRRLVIGSVSGYSFDVSALVHLEELALYDITSTVMGMERLTNIRFLQLDDYHALGTHFHCMLPSSLRQVYVSDTKGCLFNMSLLAHLEELRLSNVNPWPSGMEGIGRPKVLKLRCESGDLMPALDNLAWLEDLTMTTECGLGTDAYGCDGAFPSLKILVIRSSNGGMEKFVFYPGTMPKIEDLTLVLFQRDKLPTSITELRSLQHLRIYGNPLVIEEDLVSAFKQEGCFPVLKSLFISGREEPIKWPEHLLDRQKQGLLSIEERTTM